jgi:pyrimidine-specific ribonucleoside hydrolase
MPKPIVMDVDTGIDDALAILYAVRHPDLTLLGITCVAGNAPLDQVVINTCKVLDAGAAGDVPVAAGATQPLVERARRKGGRHGTDGLGDIQLPESSRRSTPLPAVELLRQLIMESPEPVTLLSLAPKTNVASLLTIYPDVTTRLEQIIFMGGSASDAVVEYNVWQDPEAAEQVINSPIPTLMYGLDLFDRLTIDHSDVERFRIHDHPGISLAGELLDRRDRLLGDAGALVLLTNPELFVAHALSVRIDLHGIGRGRTVVDQQATDPPDSHSGEGPRITVVLDLDVAKAASAFVETINAYAA